MRIVKYVSILTIITACFFLQACGDAKTDTNGSLSLTDPKQTINAGGTVTVSTSVTYSPPAGKVPNGVIIHIIESENGGQISNDYTLTSSPTVNLSFLVPQSTTDPVFVRIEASIGDMVSSVVSVVPIYVPPATP